MDIIKRGKQLVVAVGITVAALGLTFKLNKMSQQDYLAEFNALPKVQQEALVKVRNTPNLTEVDVGREMQELQILNNAIKEHESRWIKVKKLLDSHPGSDKASLNVKLNALDYYIYHDLYGYRATFQRHTPRLRFMSTSDFEKFLDDLEEEVVALEKQMKDLAAQREKLKQQK